MLFSTNTQKKEKHFSAVFCMIPIFKFRKKVYLEFIDYNSTILQLYDCILKIKIHFYEANVPYVFMSRLVAMVIKENVSRKCLAQVEV